jgi:dolichyl-phosphate beta-glucosyltransferase
MPQRYIRYDGEYSYVDDHLKQRTFPSLNDKATLTLSVIVPAKDEQTRLPKMLDEAIDYLQQRTRDEPAFTWEIIVVDDGSTDNTTKVARKQQLLGNLFTHTCRLHISTPRR